MRWFRTAFSVSARLRSFTFAVSGLRFMLKSQHNARIHLAATLTAVGLGVALPLSFDEWRQLILVIALVWLAEAMNTAFEHLCDVVSPAFHPEVKRAKDVAAAAVLIVSAAAALIGVLIFGPHLLPYLAALAEAWSDP